MKSFGSNGSFYLRWESQPRDQRGLQRFRTGWGRTNTRAMFLPFQADALGPGGSPPLTTLLGSTPPSRWSIDLGNKKPNHQPQLSSGFKWPLPPSSTQTSHLCAMSGVEGGKLKGGRTARYSPSQSWFLEGPPNPMGPVRSGGGSKWQNVRLPDLTTGNSLEAVRTLREAAAACQFLHQPTGSEATMPCTTGWLSTVTGTTPTS